MFKDELLFVLLICSAICIFLLLLIKLIYDKKIQNIQFKQDLKIQSLHATYQKEIQNCKALEKHKDLQFSSELKNKEIKVQYYEESLKKQKENFSEKLLLLEESKLEIKKEFHLMSKKIFDDNSKKSNDNLSLVLKPLKEQLQGFNQRINDIYTEETKQRSNLLSEIKNLKDLNVKISTEAVNLTKALKGENKTQGDWGEMILSKILEQTGLREGYEYDTQGSYTSKEGKRLRPDVVVHLPQEKDIIIDSKVSLLAYERYVNKEENKSFYVQELIKSIVQHIKDLSSKKYEDIHEIKTLDFVLLFIPIEGAFILATSKDSSLFKTAFEHNIMLVSPSSLYVSLRTIENIWRYEHQNENALIISKKAAALYDKFYAFTKDMEEIGLQVNRTKKVYDLAVNKLASGKGNLLKRSEEFLHLGVKAKKSIDKDLFKGDIE